MLKKMSEGGEIQICDNRQIMLLCQSKKKKEKDKQCGKGNLCGARDRLLS